MSFPPNLTLPTVDALKATVPDDLDALQVAKAWFTAFAAKTEAKDAEGLVGLFVEDGYWRDILSMTWDYRTFHGTPRIGQFLRDRLPIMAPSRLALDDARVALQRPYPDLAWVQGLFTFETALGKGTGVFRLVPVRERAWKAHTVFTVLEALKDAEELTGPRRDPLPNHGLWHQKRRREVECEDEEPKAIVIGGGQSGLEIAARLKYLGVKALIVEKQPRIGNQWRTRYEALCLHDPVWYDHLPYVPFPSTWPVFTPAPKLADWLENYAHVLELNIWTSATATKVTQDPRTKIWSVIVKREKADGTVAERTFKVKHVIFAVGWGGGTPNVPSYPGADTFTGQILHSSQHKSARDHIGKKVVVVGACTSGHDLCADYHKHGVDVTMYQRSPTYIMSAKHGLRILLGDLYSETGPPTEIADILNASFPNHLMYLLHKRMTEDIAEADKETLDGLKKVGFKLGWGIDGSGFLMLAWTKGGGYYLDVGTSKLISDGKIKLKNDSPIKGFTKTGLEFENGSTVDADVVIFATGYTNVREPIHKICEPDIADGVKTIWGLDEEGEINGAWRDTGVDGLYVMMGNLAACRFNSKILALQIRAMEDGVFGERYSK
ncbi:FAD/NAD(P)-binding domain-containing protein [Amylostereum chailletii]|nr:FAD/NAD(P)-binding domain-containing protein [Amylostereum chailletii]